ncbi:MAG: NfeD family protein [Spirochaetales bacterium]|nr:NfeD family protein [Spirochaetales bacterium]
MEIILLNNIPFIWLGIAILLIIIEATTVNLATIWFALGALISMVLAFLDIPFVWQILIFLILSSVLLAFTRPVLVKKLRVGAEKTNVESLVGKSGKVIVKITSDQKGQVKTGGQIWTAAAIDDKTIEEGSQIKIEKIEGVTLYVSKIENQ